jgi:hypothetical protein
VAGWARRRACRWGRADGWRRLHREGNAFSGQVHFRHGDHDFLLHLDHLSRIFDETVAELADVDQSILVNADVHKGAEGRHVGDYTRQLHARFQVLHFLHPSLECEHFKLLPRITARVGQFGQDVVERNRAYDFVCNFVATNENSGDAINLN